GKAPTTSFGEIEFASYGDQLYGEQPAKYVRVHADTDMATMEELLLNVWKLTPPKLVISVTGGAKDFHLKKRLKEAFRRGLRRAAQIPGAWIVTAGTHAGVMKHVGRAVRDCNLTREEPVTAIGVAPWGCVHNRNLLESLDGKGLWPAQYGVHKDDSQLRYETLLDDNHTHFILVDNGTENKFGTEIDFRTNLEKKISQMIIASDEQEKDERPTSYVPPSVKVPVALLVLEGGPNTLVTVKRAIDTNTPAIIIKGSGRCADVLAFAAQNASPTRESAGTVIISSAVRRRLEHMVIDVLKSKGDDVTKHVKLVESCVQKPQLISVYELDAKGRSDVDMAILKGLLKANKDNVVAQLELALAWNRVDVAQSEIFTENRTWRSGQLDEIMMSAIMHNNTEFVELILDNDFSLNRFLTSDRLHVFYDRFPTGSPLKSMVVNFKRKEEKRKAGDPPLKYIGLMLKSLLGDYYKSHHLTYQVLKDEGKNACFQVESPAQELFLWAVLMNYQNMAKLFWRRGNESTAAALVANSLLKAIAGRTDDTGHMLQTLHSNAQKDLSIFTTDKQKTQDLLVRNLRQWGNASCVLIALKSSNKRFISHSACQALGRSVWNGKVSPDTSFRRWFACLLLPVLVRNFIRFQALPSAEDKAGFPLSRFDSAKEKTLPRAPSQTTTSYSVARQQEMTACQKVKEFYTAPMAIFCLNFTTYLVFLSLYSYLLLIKLSPSFHFLEVIIFVWVFTIFIEEARQLAAYNSARSFWRNFMDFSTLAVFVIGVVLRLLVFVPCHTCYEVGRVLFSINLVQFFARLFYSFAINKELGPKIVMIRRMITDLMWFFVILLVFVFAYTVASEAILYPNTEMSMKLLYYLPRKAYWQIYGELFLDELEGDVECTNNRTLYSGYKEQRCPSDIGQYMVPIMMAVYVLVTNVLLLNLLIAMFSYTFQKVQDNTDIHWHFQRFNLIFEYSARPCLPPPLIIFSYIRMAVVWGCKKACCEETSDGSRFKQTFGDKTDKELVRWEDIMLETYLSEMEATTAESVQERVKGLAERLDSMQSKTERYFENLEDALTTTNQALTWIMKSLENKGSSCDDPKPHLPTSLPSLRS
ncbi:hypothetical protein BaRGS_00036522, partial [Batillaria attramentaria]